MKFIILLLAISFQAHCDTTPSTMKMSSDLKGGFPKGNQKKIDPDDPNLLSKKAEVDAVKGIQNDLETKDAATVKQNSGSKPIRNVCQEDPNSILRCYEQGKRRDELISNPAFKVFRLAAFADNNKELIQSSDCSCINKKIEDLGAAYPSPKRQKYLIGVLNHSIKREMSNDISNELELLIQDFAAHGQKLPKECEQSFKVLKNKTFKRFTGDSFSEFVDYHSSSPTPSCGETGKISRESFFKVSEEQMRDNEDLRIVDTAVVNLVSTISNLPRNMKKCLKEVGLDPEKVTTADILLMSERSTYSIFPSFKLDDESGCISKMNKSPDIAFLKGRIEQLKENRVLEKFSTSIGKLPFLRQALMTPVNMLHKIIKKSSRNKNEGLMLFEKLQKSSKGLSKSLSDIAAQRCEMITEKIEDIQSVESFVSLKKNGQRGFVMKENKFYPKSVLNEMVNSFYKKRVDSKNRKFTEHVELFSFLANDYCEESYNTALITGNGPVVPKTKVEIPSLLSDESLVYINEHENKNLSIPILDYANKLCEDPNYQTPFEKVIKDSGARGCFIFGVPCDSSKYRPSTETVSKSVSSTNKEYGSSTFSDTIRSLTPTNSSNSNNLNGNTNGFATPNTNKSLSDIKSNKQNNNIEDKKYQEILDELSALKRNQNETNKLKEEYKNNLFSDKKISDSEIRSFEQKLAALEKENQNLKNKVNKLASSDGSFQNNDSRGSRSLSSKLKPNSQANFKAAQKIMNDQVKNNAINGNSNRLSAAGARVLGQLSPRQLSSITSQISGNNPVSRDDAVVINVENIDNISGNVNNILDNLNKNQINEIQNAILKQQPIVIRANNSNRNLTIKPDSSEYALIAKKYNNSMKLKIDSIEKKGEAARAIASETKLFYKSLLENSENLLEN